MCQVHNGCATLAEAIGNALFKSKGKVIKTLIDEFMYPRLGAGQLYEKMSDLVRERGGRVHLNAPIVRMRREGFHIMDVIAANGEETALASGDFYLSSAPLTVLLEQLDPPPPAEIREAAAGLRYRNHISVQLVLQGETPFLDNWIYVHSPDVRMARLASYRSFSKEMAPAADLHPITPWLVNIDAIYHESGTVEPESAIG